LGACWAQYGQSAKDQEIINELKSENQLLDNQLDAARESIGDARTALSSLQDDIDNGSHDYSDLSGQADDIDSSLDDAENAVQ